jgi:O-succinylbenzoic acid--CoA ligase
VERRELGRRLGGAAGPHGGPALIATADPAEFRRRFADAAAGDGEVFLADPCWGEARRAEAVRMAGAGQPREDRGWLMVPTGGSSGGLRFARHDGHSVAAAVRGFARHFGVEQVNAVGVLPLHHVSGLLGWLRCVLTDGEHVSWDWKRLESGDWPEVRGDGWFLSLVPTQLERLLTQRDGAAHLRAYHAVLLGGAGAPSELLDRAAAAGVPLVLSYGMTETAAMVAAQRPGDFLAGDRTAGRALPHVRLELDADGVVTVGGPSLFRGYHPDWRHERKLFVTSDAGALDAAGRLTVLGRRDAVIVTGGEKVQPEEVEAALRPALGPEFAVVGVPDATWGFRVTCVHPAAARPDLAAARAAAAALAPAQRPKDYVALPEWPRTAAGKLDRARLAALAAAALQGGA